MRRARTVQAARVSIPNTGESALQISTDLDDASNRAFYVLPDTKPPTIGDWVEWGRRYAIIGEVKVRKLGYSFDPSAPLH